MDADSPVPPRRKEKPLEPPPGSNYYTSRQAAAYINVPYSTFRKIATRIKRSKLNRYRKADLDEFMTSPERPYR